MALAGAGAHVVLTARSEGELLEVAEVIHRDGGGATAMAADVTDRAAVEGLAARVEQRVGPIDLLVNNAAVFQALGVIAEIDPDAWWREMEINLLGPFLYMHAVLPQMVRRGRGRIINVASAAGLGGGERTSAYGVSKTALIRLTEAAARETREHGVTVVVIHPGNVETPMTDYLRLSAEAGEGAPHLQQFFQRLHATDGLTPAEDAAAMVLRIATGEADALTGCYLSVDDDIPALVQEADAIQKDGRRMLRMQM